MDNLSINQLGVLLDKRAEEFTSEFYNDWNGGISLLPDTMSDPSYPGKDLLILGEYCNDQMGRYINLYYGAFAELAQRGNWTETDWEEELYDTLAHEFTHHVEGLAGERGLELKDEAYLEQFRRETGES